MVGSMLLSSLLLLGADCPAPADAGARVGPVVPVLVGPTVYGFVARNWTRLLGGEVVPFRYAVVSRQETFGFELARVDAAPGQVKVQMRASNPFVALVVSPIVITYSASGQLLAYDGRTPMKSGSHGGSTDFEGHVEYALAATRFR